MYVCDAADDTVLYECMYVMLMMMLSCMYVSDADDDAVLYVCMRCR